MRTDQEPGPSLGQRFARGEESAVAEVYRRYSGHMTATATALLGDPDMAADAVQQAFVRAWRAAARSDPGRDLRPWLSVITRRMAVDVHRWHRRWQVLPVPEPWRLGGPREGVEPPSLDRAWRIVQVRKALLRLPADEREVLWLAYWAELTQREIGALLGIALGTVKSRTFRAQHRLALHLSHLRRG